jgi:hypothetical protein
MNPLSDCFVDFEAIAERQQRLLDAAADRTDPFAREDAARSPSAPRHRLRWPWRRFRFWSSVYPALQQLEGHSTASSARATPRNGEGRA